MDWLFEILWIAVKVWTRRALKGSFQNSLHKRFLLTYLTAIKSFRGLLIVGLAAFVFMQIMIFGLIGCLYTLIQLLPLAPDVRLWVLLGVSLTCLVIPFIFLLILMSEGFLFRMSGGEKLFEELTADSNRRQ